MKNRKRPGKEIVPMSSEVASVRNKFSGDVQVALLAIFCFALHYVRELLIVF